MPADTRASRPSFVRLTAYTSPIALALVAALLYFADDVNDLAPQAGSVQVVGSETMRPVVTACAEDFMTRNPRADVIVRGGGSGDGLAALLHGMVDIAMTSRPLSVRERDFAVSKGIEISVVNLALDGITVIVNPAVAITAVDLEQLQDIFTGKVRHWRQVEGGEFDVLAIARAAGSGTASLFGERVLRDKTYGPSVRHLPTNEAIVAEVATRPGAIGYTGLGALRGTNSRVKVVALRADAQSTPVPPTPATIRSGQYPLVRTLHLATAGNPSGTVKELIDFCLSASGQALLQRAGYVEMKPSPP